jgi:hypothetical protein
MMKSPKAAGETPAEKAAREAEQKRMEASQLEDTQSLLRAETLRRIRRFGQLAGASTSLPGFVGSMGSGIGAGAQPSAFGGGAGYGGGLGSFSGLQIGTA